MSDLIDRQAAIDVIRKCNVKEVTPAYMLIDKAEVMTELMRLPSAQSERKTGKWEEIEVIPEAYDIAGVKTWASKMRCNQCGFTTFAIEGKFAQYDYCPHCGADMRGKDNGRNT